MTLKIDKEKIKLGGGYKKSHEIKTKEMSIN